MLPCIVVLLVLLIFNVLFLQFHSRRTATKDHKLKTDLRLVFRHGLNFLGSFEFKISLPNERLTFLSMLCDHGLIKNFD